MTHGMKAHGMGHMELCMWHETYVLTTHGEEDHVGGTWKPCVTPLSGDQLGGRKRN